jgi:iron complex outermembrane recepter protein
MAYRPALFIYRRLFISLFAIGPQLVLSNEVRGLETRTSNDTLELSQREKRAPPPLPSAAKSVLIPSDEDRQLGNLADMLERMAGLHVVRTGQFGDYLGISIHGSTENQVNVYVNGILRNPATNPALFLGDWDLSRVERIEVYKGLAPENLPGSPMGGAINIVTREGQIGSGFQAALGAGSFGSLRANGNLTTKTENWKMHAQAIGDQGDGNFTFYDDNGTEFKSGRFPDGAPRLGADDLVRKTRRNNAHSFHEIAATLTHIISPSAEIGLEADFSQLQKQIPAPYANLDSSIKVNAFRKADQYTARSFGHWTLPGLELNGDLTVNHHRDAYVDTSGAVGAIGVGYDNQIHEYDDGMASINARTRLSDRLSVSGLASYGIASYRFADNIKDRIYPRLYRYTGEGKLTPTYTLGRNTLQAILGLTLHLQEHYGQGAYNYKGTTVQKEDRDQHGTLRIGYQFRPNEHYWFSAQGGNAYRIPTFLEKYGDRGTVLANPTLRSESGQNASATLHAQTKKASIELQGFVSEGKDIITLVQNSQFILLYRNSGDTRVIGLEARTSLTPKTWTRTELDLTFQKAQNLAGGSSVDDYKLIPFRPLTQAAFKQTFLFGAWTSSIYTYYQGLAYPNPSNLPSLFDSYSHNTKWQSRSDLMLSWHAHHFLAAASIRNIFNARNFDFFNFPQPGRSFSIHFEKNQRLENNRVSYKILLAKFGMAFFAAMTILSLSHCVLNEDRLVTEPIINIPENPIITLPEKAFVVTVNSDYKTGSFSVFGIDSTFLKLDAEAIHSDAVVRYLGGDDIFILNRLGRDNLQVVNRQNLKVVMQAPFPALSNPQDIVLKDSLLYVAFYGLAKIGIYHQKDGSSMGEIDLSAYTDSSDYLPETSNLMFIGNSLYALLANLDTKHDYKPLQSRLVKIDVIGKVVVKSLNLPYGNPLSLTYNPVNNKLYIPCRGAFFTPDFKLDLDGAIVGINLSNFSVQDTLVTEYGLGGSLNSAEYYEGRLYMDRTDSGALTMESVISIALNTQKKDTITTLPGYQVGGLAIDSTSHSLFIGDRKLGLRIFNLETGEEKLNSKISLGKLPISDLTVVR